MLDLFRKNKESLFGLFMVVLCALLLVPFGLDFMSSQTRASDAAIKVDDTQITVQEYYRRLSQWENMFRQQLGANYAQLSGMLNLPQRTIDEIINEVLLYELTGSLGLRISAPQLEAKIASHPFFGGSPVTAQSYATFLRMQNVGGSAFERMTTTELLAHQLEQTLSDLSVPTEAELKAAFAAQNTKKSYAYVAFQAQNFRDKVEINDESLKEFFEDRAENYRTKRAVTFSFASFAPAQFAANVELTDEDLQEAYERAGEKYYEPKQVKLRKIVFKKKSTPSELEKMVTGASDNDSAGNAEVRAKANQAEERLKAEEPFAAVASEVSEDEATRNDGGLVGWIEYSSLEEPLRTAAARLEEGENSRVIETADSFVLLFAEEKKESRKKPFEEVRDALAQELRASDAPAYASAAAQEFFDTWSSQNKPLAEFAQEKGVQVQTTERALHAGDSAPGVPAELSQRVASLPEGDRELLELGDVTYVVQVQAVTEPRIPEFQEVKDRVAEEYRTQEAERLAKEAAEEALSALNGAADPKSLETLASERGYKIEHTEPALPAAATGPLFMSPDARQVLGSLTPESPRPNQLIRAAGGYYLATLHEAVTPPAEEYEKKRAELVTQQMNQQGQLLVDSLLKTLRARHEVWVNPDLFESNRPQG